MNWHNVNIEKPEFLEEVFVWVDGHRGPAWCNSYALVAFLGSNGNFYRIDDSGSYILVAGVTHWAKIIRPY